MEAVEVQFNELIKKNSEKVELSEFSTNIAVFLETIVNERVKFKEEEFKQLQEKVEGFRIRGMKAETDLAEIRDENQSLRQKISDFDKRLETRHISVNDSMLSKFREHFK